jgi:protein-S-isoprenylcysteine O-methyltransferase Ste14
MRRSLAAIPVVVVLIVVIVGVDVLFFRNHFWERLIANIGVVLVFAAFYLRFFT